MSYRDDPAWFPDRFDPDNGLIRLAPTNRAILDASAFLDGRTPLSVPDATPAIVPLTDLGEGTNVPLRWILHESFCGSTLVARLAASGARACVLREPQVLVDCANRSDPRSIAVIRGLLARRWAADEPVVVKPSNWINLALPDLLDPADFGVVVTIAPARFLVAVLRGGRDRIAYVLRLHDAIVRRRPALGQIVAAAGPPRGDALATAIGMVAALHWMQRRLLDRCGPATRLVFPDLLDDPQAILDTVCAALDLTPSPVDIAGVLAVHAKSDRAADRAAESRADADIAALHADALAAALAYRDRLDAMDPPAGTARGGT